MTLRLTLLICLLASGAIASTGGMFRDLDVSAQKVLFDRKNSNGVRSAVVVSEDGTIRQIDFNLPGELGPVVTANLGTQVTESGQLRLENVLPGKVVAIARRITLNNASRLHILLAWEFSDASAETLTLFCSLYILKEDQGKVERVLATEEAGKQLHSLIVEDVNGDGKPEILLITRDEHTDYAYIYQIQPSGKVIQIQEFDSDMIRASERFVGDNFIIYVGKKEESVAPGNVCHKFSRYIWSQSYQKFVPEKRKGQVAGKP